MRRNTLSDLIARLVPGPNGCLLWPGAKLTSGYGIAWFQGRPQLIHRLLYENLVAPIPDGMQIDHLCRNRACANPKHLEPVTRRENILRGVGPTAMRARRATCFRGHPLSGDNLYQNPKGERHCRACHRAPYRNEAAQQKARRARASP